MRRALLVGLCLVFTACAGERQPAEQPAQGPALGAPPLYLAVLDRSQEVWPQALILGAFRIVDGCALLDQSLLVLPHGARVASGPDGGPVVRLGGSGSATITPGHTVTGSGGGYAVANVASGASGWNLEHPIPERCARIASEAVVVSPSAILPPSAFEQPIYAAVQREDLRPGPLAPIGGELRVVDQCLLLGEALLILPAESYVEYKEDGTLAVRIAARQYRETILARPGDQIVGSGAGAMAEAEPLPAMPRPLAAPIPERCRPPGRPAVMLNPGPDVTRGSSSSYRDPGSAGTFGVPPPSPPRPVTDPADCPPGSRITHGLCRDPEGRLVRARNAPR